MAVWSYLLKKLEEFEEWLAKIGGTFEKSWSNDPRTTVQRKCLGLVLSLLFPISTAIALFISLCLETKLHYGWLLGLIICPIVVFVLGWFAIEPLQESAIARRHSIVLDLFFYFLSVGVSLTISFTGLQHVIMVIVGCVFILWTALIEMIFDFATPMGLVGIAVSGTISVILNMCEIRSCNILLGIPICLGMAMIIFSWRYKNHVFKAPSH